MTETTTQTNEESKTTSISINFLNGGFAEFKGILGYQIQQGIISILTTDGTAELYPLTTVQNISITQKD
jgi:hypothetical protein